MVASEPPGLLGGLGRVFLPDRRERTEAVSWALSVTELEDVAGRFPTELSHGQRKLVGVGRALACRPSLLLLDEPAAGLDTDETLVLGQRLRTLPEHGVSVLLIDHDMGLVLSVCDRVMVLDFGNLIAEGTPAEIRANPAVIEAYLGSSEAGGAHEEAVTMPAPRPPPPRRPRRAATPRCSPSRTCTPAISASPPCAGCR